MPQLIIKWGNRETRFAVTTPSVDIGRSDDNLLQIKDVKVSRYQCKIVQTPLGFLLSDLESSNGTFLNGKRVDRTLLHNNDAIKIGNVEIVFSESNSGPAENKGPVVISLGQPADDASVGEVTTVLNVYEENDSAARNNSVTGSVKNGRDGISNGATAVAQVAKRVEPVGNPQNGVAKPVNGIAMAKPVTAQRVMNNHILQNGSGKPSGTPAPPPLAGAQPARPVAPQFRPGGMPAAQNQVPRIPPPAQKPPAPASRIIPPAPKPQSGVISRLAKPSASSAGRISSISIKAAKAGKPAMATGRQAVPTGRQADATQGSAQPKKNKNMLYIIGAAALILIVIIAFVASSGSNKKAEEDSQREVEVLNKIDKLYAEKEYSVALKKYEAFLKEFKDSKHIDKVKENIKKIEEHVKKEKTAGPKLVELKRKKKDYPTSQYPELLKEFDNFIKEYSDIAPAIIQEAKSERDMVQRVVSSSGGNESNVRVNEVLGEANALRNKKDYDGAIAKLKSFLDKNTSLNDRQENTIMNEIKAIEKEKGEKSEKK